MTVLISYGQKSESKCFAPVEIDSLYSKFVYFDFVKKENTLLKEALTKSNETKAEQVKKISILNTNIDVYHEINDNNKLVIDKLNQSLRNQTELTKIEKKKKLPIFFKGVGIGVGISVTTFLLLR